MGKIESNILKKLPLEIQNGKIRKFKLHKEKEAKISSTFYQSNNIMNENFHRPISKCFILNNE